jgi:hypothetical protein
MMTNKGVVGNDSHKESDSNRDNDRSVGLDCGVGINDVRS